MPSNDIKTVYFLGAGASRASRFTLPVMSEFFQDGDLGLPQYQNIKRFLDENFPDFSCEKLNLEDVITCLDLSVDTFGRFGSQSPAWIEEARRETQQYILGRLNVSVDQPCEEHLKICDKKLAGNDSRDTIITVNYDLIVEYALFSNSQMDDIGQLSHDSLLDRMYGLLGHTQLIHGDRPSLYHKHVGLGFYLKLHGSLDWLYCSNPACENHKQFFANWIGASETHNALGDLCCLCGTPLAAVLVPPTMNKSFDKYPKLGFLWSLAYKELNVADIIVFFGISFAASDYYLRWLVKKAILDRSSQPQIVNIDICNEPAERIKEITGIEAVPMKTVDDFLEWKQRN